MNYDMEAFPNFCFLNDVSVKFYSRHFSIDVFSLVGT